MGLDGSGFLKLWFLLPRPFNRNLLDSFLATILDLVPYTTSTPVLFHLTLYLRHRHFNPRLPRWRPHRPHHRLRLHPPRINKTALLRYHHRRRPHYLRLLKNRSLLKRGRGRGGPRPGLHLVDEAAASVGGAVALRHALLPHEFALGFGARRRSCCLLYGLAC